MTKVYGCELWLAALVTGFADEKFCAWDGRGCLVSSQSKYRSENDGFKQISRNSM